MGANSGQHLNSSFLVFPAHSLFLIAKKVCPPSLSWGLDSHFPPYLPYFQSSLSCCNFKLQFSSPLKFLLAATRLPVLVITHSHRCLPTPDAHPAPAGVRCLFSTQNPLSGVPDLSTLVFPC